MLDILVLGELNADLILRGDVVPEWNQTEKLIDDAALTLGSSSAIFACGAARLGLRVAFVGVVGDDLLGRFCREALDARGVDTSGEWAGLDAVLAATDILLPNEAEACALAGLAGWRLALEALAGRVATVALKRGASGAAAMRGAAFAEAAAPVVQVVDAVGAGDS